MQFCDSKLVNNHIFCQVRNRKCKDEFWVYLSQTLYVLGTGTFSDI